MMKVVVAGASTSGLYLAYLLASEGIEVEVYEKEKEGNIQRRTLIVTNKMNVVLGFDISEALINNVSRYEFLTDGQKAIVELEEPDLVLERKKLLMILAERAKAAGAKIYWGNELVEINKLNRTSAQDTASEKYDYSYKIKKNDIDAVYIGADEDKIKRRLGQLYGPRTKIFSLRLREVDSGREWLIERNIVVLATGVSWAHLGNGQRKLALVQARVAFPEPKLSGKLTNVLPQTARNDLRARTSQVWLDSNLTRYFFWLIPESAKVAAVGLIDERESRALEILRQFLAERNLKPIEIQAAIVPEYKGKMTPFFSCSNDLYAVGDAAAQVKMSTVGGVVAGLRGARAVAEAILHQNSYRRMWRELYLELNLHYWLRRILNNFHNGDYRRLLARLERDKELRQMLGRWNRDELTKLLFKLLIKRPWLIGLALRKCASSILLAKNIGLRLS